MQGKMWCEVSRGFNRIPLGTPWGEVSPGGRCPLGGGAPWG